MSEEKGGAKVWTEYEPPREGAPFEGELIEVDPGGGLDVFPRSMATEHHVDAEAGSTGVADVGPGSLVTSLPSPSERLDLVALEKDCMNPPCAGDSFAEAIP